MRFFSTALALAAVPAAVLGASQTVTVGDGGALAFNPPNITAAVGDQVNFEFHAKNHSVTQSTFASPCTKAMFNGSQGINSGFLAMPMNATTTNGSFPTWTIQVNGTGPLWFYCAQKIPVSHCEMGMVFSINATPEKSFDMFQTAAKASNTTDPAAAGAPAGGASPGGVSTGGASAGGASPSGTATGSPGSSPSASGAGGAASSPAATAATSQESSNSPAPQKPNGASKVALTRGAAGLLTVAAVAAVL